MCLLRYRDVIMNAMASQITGIPIVYSIVYLGDDQRKQQSSASLAYVRGIHRRPVNSPHKWPVTRKMFPFDDVSWTLFISNNHQRWSFVILVHHLLTIGGIFLRKITDQVNVNLPHLIKIGMSICVKNALLNRVFSDSTEEVTDVLVNVSRIFGVFHKIINFLLIRS